MEVLRSPHRVRPDVRHAGDSAASAARTPRSFYKSRDMAYSMPHFFPLQIRSDRISKPACCRPDSLKVASPVLLSAVSLRVSQVGFELDIIGAPGKSHARDTTKTNNQ
jgi:hypothetical protein